MDLDPDQRHAGMSSACACQKTRSLVEIGERGVAGLRNQALLERERELDAIEQALEDVRGGRNRLLVVEGAPGVGKTRVISAARERARVAGLQNAAARASELEESFAFGVIRQLLGPVVAELDQNDRARVMQGRAEMASRPLALGYGPMRVEGDALMTAFDGLFWLCAGLAHERPLLLAVDDAHWCDEASLRWFAFAVPRFESLPILIVLGCRPSEPGVDGPKVIGELARLESAEVLAPRPLSRAAVKGLVAQLADGAPAPAFVDACHDATRGNPLLLHELLVEIETTGLAPTNANAAAVAGLGSRRVAEGVLRRVQQLGGDAMRVTRSLAVLGDRAELGCVRALAGVDEESALDAAARLVDAGVVAQGFPLEFAHPLVRSAIYESLPYAERLVAHGRAARILADAGMRAEAVAAHLLIVPPSADSWVVDVLRQAAADAAAQGSSRDAVNFLRRALQEPPDELVRGDVLAELGVCEHNAGDSMAVGHLVDALELAEDVARRARVGLVLARAIWHEYRIVDAVALLDSLIDDLGDELAGPLEAELVAIARLDPRTRQTGLRVLGRRDGTVRNGDANRLLLANLCFERAVAAAISAEDVAALAQDALTDGMLLREEGSENTIYHLAAWALAQCDRFADAEAAFQAAIDLARSEGSVAGYARALTFRANMCYRRGLVEEAEGDATHALDQLTSIRAPLTVAFLLDVLIERDELQAAEELLRRFNLAGDLPGSILHTIVLERRGRLWMARGKARDAVRDLQLCAERAEEWGAGSPAFLAWRSSAALALARVGRRREAKALAEEELARAQKFGAQRAVGVAMRAVGLLSAGSAAVDVLDRAVDVLRDSGATLEYARAQVDLGAALHRAGQRSRAREPLRAGLELAQHCGAKALARRARVELRSAGGRPIRLERKGLDALTPAELRVARMAAAGMGNRDIAEALFVIPKTVEWHLSQTYRKLRIHSRAELPAALEQNSGEPTPRHESHGKVH
jgi:DNA-binding NarL/FixJ family response regulator